MKLDKIDKKLYDILSVAFKGKTLSTATFVWFSQSSKFSATLFNNANHSEYPFASKMDQKGDPNK
jgi:hypothetical protein